MLRYVISVFTDLYTLLRSKFFSTKKRGYSFAFLVHARGHSDIFRKFPFFKYLPKAFALYIMKHLWPITLSKVTGLKNIKDGSEVPGYVIGITMTAEQMMKNKKKALKKIRDAMYLASGKGVSIVGLGGLTSSLSGGGLQLLDLPVNITTGHAYTAYNVTANVFQITKMFDVPKESLKIGIVGAAGSIGSMSGQILARAGYGHIVLIDIPRKIDSVMQTATTWKQLYPNVVIDVSDNISLVSSCDILVTATNTPEALITTNLVSPGMVIIDDAQPSDIHIDVLKLPDVLVLEAGVVHTPGIHSNFNYGLKNKTDNFCCMAELLILASNMWDNHYVINRATIEHVDEISEMGKKLGFELASFQNFLESISSEKVEHVKKKFRERHGIYS